MLPQNLHGRYGWRETQGLTKVLNKKIILTASCPRSRCGAADRAGTGEALMPGASAARNVDAQVSRVINQGPSAANTLTSTTHKDLLRRDDQARTDTDPRSSALSCSCRVGTAADVIAYDEAHNRLVVVELKSGYDQGRDLPATRGGKECRLSAPLSGVKDTTRARHMTQLLATWAMLKREKKLFERLAELGVNAEVGAVLLYCNDQGAESAELCDWWFRRGAALLEALK